MADSLTNQFVFLLQSNQVDFSRLCVNPSHDHGCPLLQALQFITINDVMVLIASCCYVMNKKLVAKKFWHQHFAPLPISKIQREATYGTSLQNVAGHPRDSPISRFVLKNRAWHQGFSSSLGYLCKTEYNVGPISCGRMSLFGWLILAYAHVYC